MEKDHLHIMYVLNVIYPQTLEEKEGTTVVNLFSVWIKMNSLENAEH